MIPKARIIPAIERLLIVAATLPVAAAGICVGALAGWLHFAPPLVEVQNYNPPEMTRLLDRQGAPLAALYEQQRVFIPFPELPPVLPRAFVAIEDARFYQHFGVDPLGIARAAAINAQRGRFAQGASTITQQAARNAIERVGRQKSLERKLTEILLALQMEHDLSKEQILEIYLNQIYLGSGTYGVEAAAQRYFSKPVHQLTIGESALLAGLPQLPERYSPLNNPDLARKRRNAVLFAMLQQGIITDQEYDGAVVQDVGAAPSSWARREAPYYLDAVQRTLASHPGLDGEEELRQAGWVVETCVEPNLQRAAEQVLKSGLAAEEGQWLEARHLRWAAAPLEDGFSAPPQPGQVRMAKVVRLYGDSLVVELGDGWRADLAIPEATERFFREPALQPGDGVDLKVTERLGGRLFAGRLLPDRGLQGALVCLEAATGDVLALAGGADFSDAANGGFFNRALLARRQAGSTLKPFFFSLGLEQGMTPETILADMPRTFADGYEPRNFEENFLGTVTLRYAMEHSRNLPTINLVEQVGLGESLRHLAAFQRGEGRRWNLRREWPVVLGAVQTTPLEIAAAYQPLANGGVARGPRLVRRIRSASGQPMPPPPVPPEQRLLSPEAAAALRDCLNGVMLDGTGKKLLPQIPQELWSQLAGKSGTTNENRDAWFAGFTDELVVVVWVGFDTPLPLGPGRTGSSVAGTIWAEYLAQLYGRPEKEMAEGGLP